MNQFSNEQEEGNSDDEAKRVVSKAYDEVHGKREKQTEEAKIAPLLREYSDRVADLFTLPYHQRRQELDALKAQFQARGLDTNRVVLSGNVLSGRRDPAYDLPTEPTGDENAEVLEHAKGILHKEAQRELEAQYREAITSLLNSGVVGNAKRERFYQIKHQYASQGLDVDRIDFTKGRG